MSAIPIPTLWTPWQRRKPWRPPRRWWKNPFHAMAAGDTMLDASGNHILNTDGTTMLDDGSGECCLFQARLCSDNTLAAMYVRKSQFPMFPATFYFYDTPSATCYYVQSTDAAPCTSRPIASPTTIVDCSDARCSGGTGSCPCGTGVQPNAWNVAFVGINLPAGCIVCPVYGAFDRTFPTSPVAINACVPVVGADGVGCFCYGYQSPVGDWCTAANVINEKLWAPGGGCAVASACGTQNVNFTVVIGITAAKAFSVYLWWNDGTPNAMFYGTSGADADCTGPIVINNALGGTGPCDRIDNIPDSTEATCVHDAFTPFPVQNIGSGGTVTITPAAGC